MLAAPEEIPETTPVEPTVAIVLLLLLHAPPIEVFPKVVVPPTQALGVPLIAAGVAVMVMVCVAFVQPLLNE